LGGQGVVAEIDEAKFGKRKFNTGHLIDGKWVFGGFKHGSKIVPWFRCLASGQMFSRML